MKNQTCRQQSGVGVWWNDMFLLLIQGQMTFKAIAIKTPVASVVAVSVCPTRIWFSKKKWNLNLGHQNLKRTCSMMEYLLFKCGGERLRFSWWKMRVQFFRLILICCCWMALKLPIALSWHMTKYLGDI